MNNYWARFTQNRLQRRRFLGGAVALSAGVAAMALTGCSDDDNDGDSSGSAQPPAGSFSTEDPVRGGVYGYVGGAGAANLNVVNDWQMGHTAAGANVYDRLISSR